MKIYARSDRNNLIKYVGKPLWLLIGAPNGDPANARYLKFITLNDPDFPKYPVRYYSIRQFDIENKSGLYDEDHCTQTALYNLMSRFEGEVYTDEEMMKMIGVTAEDEE